MQRDSVGFSGKAVENGVRHDRTAGPTFWHRLVSHLLAISLSLSLTFWRGHKTLVGVAIGACKYFHFLFSTFFISSLLIIALGGSSFPLLLRPIPALAWPDRPIGHASPVGKWLKTECHGSRRGMRPLQFEIKITRNQSNFFFFLFGNSVVRCRLSI